MGVAVVETRNVMVAVVQCNAPRPTLQTPSLFFVIVACIYLFVAFIIASYALHPHVFINSWSVRSSCFSLLPSLSLSRPTVLLLSDRLSLSAQCTKPLLARVRKLSRTRPGLLLPMGPDHPLTSLNHHRFLVGLSYPIFFRPSD